MGTSAFNIRGVTIFSWAGIGLGNGSVQVLLARMRPTARKRVASVRALIIDESSMVSGELLNELCSFSSLLRRPVSRDGTLSTVFCCLHAWLRPLDTRLRWHPALLQLPATLMYSLLVTAGDPVNIRLLDWQLTR